MTNFVLVHGIFGGARSWRALVPLLRARGHEVYAQSLTGLGERAHLAGPQTNLSTHIQDIVAIIESEDLREVVLAGHSYGGMVITGAADRVPERIAHLVYVDALLPADGKACSDLEGFDQVLAMRLEDGWLLRPPDLPDMARLPSRGHPMGTLTEKLHLSMPLEERAFTRTYVIAGGSPVPRPEEQVGNFWNAAKRVRHHPAWRYVELPFGHDLHREHADVIAGLLFDLVKNENPVSEALPPADKVDSPFL
jgi:pimeloyl-ACP methyl ester carboxylesterase